MQKNKRKYLLAGGGTGGHLFPALAIAEEIEKNDPDAEILFVGTKNKIEARLVPEKGYAFRSIWISGFKRKISANNFLFPLKIIVSMIQSFNILKNYKPDVVIGTGGYVCGPVLFSANILGIKTVIHESNSYPGLVTRLMANKVTKVLLTFEETKKWLKSDNIAEITGNPTRKSLLNISKKEGLNHFNFSDTNKTILVFGGSLGASSINNAILSCIEFLIEKNIQIIWQTGNSDYEKIKNNLDSKESINKQNLKLLPFIDKMEYAYAAADLVLSRSGATTISELTLLGKPAILVPYPFAAADHQTINARTLETSGAVVLISDNDIQHSAHKTIVELIVNNDKLSEMSKRSLTYGKPQAAKNIYNNIKNIIQ